ncbi:MAG: hypothetical protein S4CHLAM45_07000 [Chlamydiales bacterium]|nr:hypothetical protein [Chlamydiales bacterium]MCH9620282.1 hypothetical protein [Chlamydiales bacterium]MCH9622807.1 hypothetical protein [Chlamydiales bacterium]
MAIAAQSSLPSTTEEAFNRKGPSVDQSGLCFRVSMIFLSVALTILTAVAGYYGLSAAGRQLAIAPNAGSKFLGVVMTYSGVTYAVAAVMNLMITVFGHAPEKTVEERRKAIVAQFTLGTIAPLAVPIALAENIFN